MWKDDQDEREVLSWLSFLILEIRIQKMPEAMPDVACLNRR